MPAANSAVTIEFSDTIDPAINARVLALDAALQAEKIAGIVETVPTYRSLMVQFDPLTIDYEAFVRRARELATAAISATTASRRWRVPVVYGGAFGIDLEDVAAFHKLTPSQIIDRHAGALYRVYMIGFMPGFTYLGGLDQSIAVPRRLDPRPMTPAGTISIGGIQALIACQAMPSGWHLLGRTPVRAFVADRTPAVLFEPGDEVQFEPVDANRWDALDQRAADGDVIAEFLPR